VSASVVVAGSRVLLGSFAETAFRLGSSSSSPFGAVPWNLNFPTANPFMASAKIEHVPRKNLRHLHASMNTVLLKRFS
jgi:hypothetical protein